MPIFGGLVVGGSFVGGGGEVIFPLKIGTGFIWGVQGQVVRGLLTFFVVGGPALLLPPSFLNLSHEAKIFGP